MSDENSQTLSENLTAEKIEPEIQKTEDEEEILCDLTRSDQQGEDEFICGVYEPK